MQPAETLAVSDSSCCYLCNQCASSFPSLAELECHMATHREESSAENSPSSSDGSLFPFEESSEPPIEKEKNTLEEAKPTNRINDCGRGKLFPCRFCSKLFGSRSLLNIHYTHTHRDKPQYECEDCGQIFSVKRELATHRRVHSGEQTHSCAQCGKEFGTRQLLKKHWMWHTGQRSHVCPHCGKAFFQKGHLTQHLMIHAGGRPHVCQLCNKTFIFKFDLNRHMKIHAERGFSCGKCGKAFLKQSLLLDHQGTCTETSDSELNKSALSEKLKAEERREQQDVKTEENQPRNTPASLPSVQQPFLTPQRLVCLLCMQEFPSQAAYSLHFSYAHFREAALHLQQQQAAAAGFLSSQNTPNTSGSGIFASSPPTLFPLSILNDSVLSSGASQKSPGTNTNSGSVWNKIANGSSYSSASFQKSNNDNQHVFTSASDNSGHCVTTGTTYLRSDINASAIEEGDSMQMEADSSMHFDGASSDSASNCLLIDQSDQNGAIPNAKQEMEVFPTAESVACTGCHSANSQLATALTKLSTLQQTLVARDTEISRLKEKMRRVGAVAGSLLESCSEFDKLWMLHSKKVYSQIQSVLNSLE